MGLVRMGQIIKVFPMPLVTGFTNGITVLIFLTQLKELCTGGTEMHQGFATLQALNKHWRSSPGHPGAVGRLPGADFCSGRKAQQTAATRRLWRWCWPVC